MSSRIEYVFDEVALHLQGEDKDIGLLKVLLDDLALDGANILEVGCGMGDNLIYCMRKGARFAEGFDFSQESIKVAQRKAAGLPVNNIRFFRCDLKEYVIKQKFDYVLAWGVFEYFDDPFQSLKKIVSCVADSGTLLLLISKPIFIKRTAFLLRGLFSWIPRRAVVSTAKTIARTLEAFKPLLGRSLYLGESSTYSLQQTILESLMVSRYNVFHHRAFTEYLKEEGYSVRFFNGVSPSMVCIIARKDSCK